MDFPPVKWVVPGILPEGLTLLAGKPKLGKSWLALNIALAVGSGGEALGVHCGKGDVLYVALEDNRRRLKRRIAACGDDWPEAVSFATEFPQLGLGAKEAIDAWSAGAGNPKLVIIDTFGRARAAAQGKRSENNFAADYEVLGPLQTLAGDLGIAVVVVHHTRKAEAEDPVDMISGTLGLAGAADAFIVLSKSGDGVTLYGRGRDLEDFDYAVEFDRSTCRWKLLGEAAEVVANDNHQRVLDAIDIGVQTPSDLARWIGVPQGSVRSWLKRMADRGLIRKEGGGYVRNTDPLTPCNARNDCNGASMLDCSVAPVAGVAVPRGDWGDFQ